MPPKPDRIQDEALRADMQQAQAALKSADYYRAVRLSSDAYVALLGRKPELLHGAEQFRSVLFFPRLGARLVVNNHGGPEVIYDRDTFTFSEAVTYYEFAVDNLIKHGL
jgi:hypothetical protein